MVWMPWAHQGPLGARSAQLNEYRVAEMLASICQMTRRRLVARRIAFRHAAPRDVSVHQELLGRAPEFEASFDGFEAELACLAEPVRNENVKLRAYFEKQCERAREAFASDPAFTALLRQRLAGAQGGWPHSAWPTWRVHSVRAHAACPDAPSNPRAAPKKTPQHVDPAPARSSPCRRDGWLPPDA
jgi:hypothetical protein